MKKLILKCRIYERQKQQIRDVQDAKRNVHATKDKYNDYCECEFPGIISYKNKRTNKRRLFQLSWYENLLSLWKGASGGINVNTLSYSNKCRCNSDGEFALAYSIDLRSKFFRTCCIQQGNVVSTREHVASKKGMYPEIKISER